MISRLTGPSGTGRVEVQAKHERSSAQASRPSVRKVGVNKKVLPTSRSQKRNRHQQDLSKNPFGGLNTFARVLRRLQKRWAGLLAKRNRHFSSQWRDRAGFTPASLFSPMWGTQTLLRKISSDKNGRTLSRSRHTSQTVLSFVLGTLYFVFGTVVCESS